MKIYIYFLTSLLFTPVLIGQNITDKNQKGKFPIFAPVIITTERSFLKQPKSLIVNVLDFDIYLKDFLKKKGIFEDIYYVDILNLRNSDARYNIHFRFVQTTTKKIKQGCNPFTPMVYSVTDTNMDFVYSFVDQAKNKYLYSKSIKNIHIKNFNNFEKSACDSILVTVEEALKQYRPVLFDISNHPLILKDIVITIIPFSSAGKEAKKLGLGESFTAMLTTFFTTNKWVNVVERERLTKILLELKINLTGLIEPSTIKKVGKLLGVKYFITGTITKLNDRIEIDMKIIDVETGQIIYSNHDYISKITYLRYLSEDIGYKALSFFIGKNK